MPINAKAYILPKPDTEKEKQLYFILEGMIQDIRTLAEVYIDKDGQRELTADWDAGAHKITAQQLAVTGVTIHSDDVSLATTKKVGLNAGLTNYIVEPSANIMDFYTAGAKALSIDASGRVTKPLQTYLWATAAEVVNIAMNGTPYTIVGYNKTTAPNIEIGGANFAIDTGLFTAPVAGKYFVHGEARLYSCVNNTTYRLRIMIGDTPMTEDMVRYTTVTLNYLTLQSTTILNLALNDVVKLALYSNEGANTTDLEYARINITLIQ